MQELRAVVNTGVPVCPSDHDPDAGHNAGDRRTDVLLGRAVDRASENVEWCETLLSRSSLQNQWYARCSSTSWANLRSGGRPFQYPTIMSSGSIDGRANVAGTRASGRRQEASLPSLTAKPAHSRGWRCGGRRWRSIPESGRRPHPLLKILRDHANPQSRRSRPRVSPRL
jgi:hypothetical protein